MKCFQGSFDDFLSGVISDRLCGEGLDSTDDSLNTSRCNFEKFVHMLCLNGSKRLRQLVDIEINAASVLCPA